MPVNDVTLFLFFTDKVIDPEFLYISFVSLPSQIHPNLTAKKKTNLLFHSSVVQKARGLVCFLCFESHKTNIKVLTGLSSFLEALVNNSFIGLFRLLAEFIPLW